MPSTPSNTTDAQNTPASEALQPELPDLIPQELSQYGPALAGLTTIQRLILWNLVENMWSETRRTEAQIAVDLEIDRKTIQRARQNPLFQDALALLTRDAIRGQHDKIIASIAQHGLLDWKASEFLLKYDGSYTPQSKQLNVNANLSMERAGSTGSVESDCDNMLIRLGELGMTRQDVEALADRFDELRHEGAF